MKGVRLFLMAISLFMLWGGKGYAALDTETLQAFDKVQNFLSKKFDPGTVSEEFHYVILGIFNSGPKSYDQRFSNTLGGLNKVYNRILSGHELEKESFNQGLILALKKIVSYYAPRGEQRFIQNLKTRARLIEEKLDQIGKAMNSCPNPPAVGPLPLSNLPNTPSSN